MTQEEKAKRYDKALEKAKGIHSFSSDIAEIKRMEQIFPELAESEDERTRKELIQFIKNWKDPNNIGRPHDFPTLTRNVEQCDRYIAWLEKQGEQKHADKVQPKFHRGEWIVHQGTEKIYQVIGIVGNQYQLKYGDNYTIQKCANVDRCARLWDITKDAKDGDVLVHNGCTFIFKGIKDGIVQAIEENILEPVSFGKPDEDNDYHPATKEQRELLFSKMKDAGYEFDFEKKELKKVHVIDEGKDEMDYCFTKI